MSQGMEIDPSAEIDFGACASALRQISRWSRSIGAGLWARITGQSRDLGGTTAGLKQLFYSKGRD
jgi:phosphoglycerate dehydrogenase-like enzyme